MQADNTQGSRLSYLAPAVLALIVAGPRLEYVHDPSGLADINFLAAAQALLLIVIGVAILVRPSTALLLVLAVASGVLASGSLYQLFIQGPADLGEFAAKYPTVDELCLWALPIAALAGASAAHRAHRCDAHAV